MQGSVVRIVIADDHQIFREGVKLTLSKLTDVVMLAEASNGVQLVELVKKHQPQVVITDIKMPQMDGIEATRKIKAILPNVGIIALSMFDQDDLILDMLEAGASGYLLKNADKDEIAEAIRSVAVGDPYYCKTTNSKLTRLIASSRFNPYQRKLKPVFTEKELEIIELICKELTNKEIADKLFMSIRTVEGHRQKILDKMEVKNSVGLVIYALQNGIVRL